MSGAALLLIAVTTEGHGCADPQPVSPAWGGSGGASQDPRRGTFYFKGNGTVLESGKTVGLALRSGFVSASCPYPPCDCGPVTSLV